MTKSSSECNTSANKKARKAKSSSHKGKAVPLDEMRRLMRVYGSIKSLRQRRKEGLNGLETMKADSLKRKFYRWFPDLDERFVKDENNFYRPRAGHIFEMQYREMMRARDGQTLILKRKTSRRENLGLGKMETSADGDAFPLEAVPATKLHTSSIFHERAGALPESSLPHKSSPAPLPQEWDVWGACSELPLAIDRMASGHIVADIGPADGAFLAEEGIFDDVESSFYGVTALAQDCPIIVSTSCSSSSSMDGHGSGNNALGIDESPSMNDCSIKAPAVMRWSPYCPGPERQMPKGCLEGDTAPFIPGRLANSIGECCDEVWGGADDDDCSIPGYFLDMIYS